LDHIKRRVLEKSKVYLNINQALDSENLSNEVTALHYNIESISELEVFRQKLADDLKSRQSGRTFVFVSISDSVSVA